MKITVVGIGYVGLSMSLLLSKKNDVLAYDIDANKVDSLNNRTFEITDKEINKYVKENVLSLTATSSKIEAYKNAEIVIVCTPTDYDEKTKRFNSDSVEQVINDVKEINPNAWIVIKSTVGVGFTKNIIGKTGFSNIVFSPEFLREDKLLSDNLNPTRVIVGIPEENGKYRVFAEKLIKILCENALNCEINHLIMGATEAESVKLFSNTFLALRISYFNELDTFAKTKKLNTEYIINGVCADPRIGDFYNNPSFGYGGYCLPKDTKELINNYENIPENLMSAIVESNKTRKEFIVEDIISSLKSKKDVVGIYRLAMKRNSNNFRSSSILDIISKLKEKGIEVVVYEPLLYGDFKDYKVINELEKFKNDCDLIVANRVDESLLDVKEKIYSRDLFKRD